MGFNSHDLPKAMSPHKTKKVKKGKERIKQKRKIKRKKRTEKI